VIFIYSQQYIKLTIDDALKLAFKNNFDIKIEKLNKDEKLLFLISNYNRLVPSTSFSGTLTKSQIVPNDNNKSTNSLNFNFDLTFSFNAKIIFDICSTIFDYNEGKISYDIAKLNITRDIKKAYYNLKLAIEKIKVQEIESNNAKEKYNIAFKNYNNGEVSEIEKLTAEYYYKKSILELNKMRNAYLKLLNNFKIIIGIKEDENIDLVSELPDYSSVKIDKIKKLDLSKDLKFKLLNTRLINSRNELYKSISLMTPTFKFGYSLNSSFLKDPYVNSWFDNYQNDYQNTQYIRFFLSIPLDPLFPLSTYQTDVSKKSFELSRVTLNMENEIKLRKIELDYSINKIQEILMSLDTQKFNVDITERAYKLTERDYNNSQKTYLELKEAEKNFHEARISYLDSKFELYSIIADIENMTNTDIFDIY
jgi:outer membrane protein TolC